MSTIPMLMLVILGVFLAYAIVAPVALNVTRFAKRTWLFCPDHQEYAQIRLHPLSAALTAGYGAPALSVRRCTLLKPDEVCDENCLRGAEF